MLNTAPSRSLTRLSRRLLLLGFISGSVGVFFVALGLFLRFVPTFFGQATSPGRFQRGLGMVILVIGVIGIIAGIALAIRALTRRRENDLAFVTGRHMSQFLDERYQFIRNINQPDLGYIDAVLVGPPGLLVFRIMERAGDLLNEKDGWVRKDRNNRWVPMRVNPTKEAQVDVKAVREFLVKKRISELDVYGVVVFINDPNELRIQLRQPVVPVAYLSGLLDVLKDDYLVSERMKPKTIQRITRLLLGEDA
jgi:hypothetical protein